MRNVKLRRHIIARVEALAGGSLNESFYKSSIVACRGTVEEAVRRRV
jgi:hypothetical protein